MSHEKEMDLQMLDEHLDTIPGGAAQSEEVQTETNVDLSAAESGLRDVVISAAASDAPAQSDSPAFALHATFGNAALSHMLIQRKETNDNAAGPLSPAPEGTAAAPTQASTVRPLIVEDTAETVEADQMKRSQFLAELRNAVSNVTAQALAGTVWSEVGFPYIQTWLAYYNKQDSKQLERAVRKYLPEAGAVNAANAFIPLIAAKVRRSVTTWVTTGEVTGLPEGLPLEIPGLPANALADAAAQISGASTLIGAVGSIASGIENLLFKEREGGANEVANPVAVQTELGAGNVLDAGVRSRMETAYGESFGGVQVHADANAATLSENLNARAFTVGDHIAFGLGEYQPGTPIGDALIAHELAHVVQQRGAGQGMPPQSSGDGTNNALEDEADRAAVGAVVSSWTGARTGVSKRLLPSLKSSLKLQRCGNKKPKPAPAPPPTFVVYQEKFNTLWNQEPFSKMPAADTGFDPTLSSRGPRTRKARKIFEKILADDAAMLAAYNANTGGIRDQIDRFIGPEGLNLINSPRLTALHAAFVAHPKPVPAASYAAFKTSVQTAAAKLDPADRRAVESSNDWQRLINDWVTDPTQRAEIRLIISPPAPAAPVAPVGPAKPVGPRGTPAQRATFLATWSPAITFNDGTRQVVLQNKSVVRYLQGSQNFEVGAALPAGQTNPGLVLSIRAQISRAAVLISPAQEAPFQPDANSLAAFAMPVLAPAVVPATGDVLTIKLEVVEPSGAGMTVVSTKTVTVSVLPEVTYTQGQAEAEATADDTFFHDASPAGLLGKMTAKGGVEANVANSLNTGRLVLRPLTVRHDSSAFVTAQNAGVADPTKVGYFVGPTYANSIVLPQNAAGTTLNAPPGIVVNRTTDVKTKAKRADNEVILFFVHEAVHAFDIEPTEGGDLKSYKTEFRAYWMDGRYGPPNSGGPDTQFDPNLPPPGPKSPRARKIFEHLYEGTSYAHIKRAYDSNAGGFREVVDSYHIPDGINLIGSTRLDSLRALIEGWGGVGFPAFRTSVQGFVGVGAAPAGGALLPDERNEIVRNRSWRDLVERKVTVAAEQSLIKADLSIP